MLYIVWASFFASLALVIFDFVKKSDDEHFGNNSRHLAWGGLIGSIIVIWLLSSP